MSIIDTLSRPRESVNRVSTDFTSQQICNAMRTVITFTITDVFDLDPDESLWVSYQLHDILDIFEDMSPKALPASVVLELVSKKYSSNLTKRKEGQYVEHVVTDKEADLSDWVNIFMEMVTSSYYPIRPLQEAVVRGSIRDLLSTLGVGIEKSPRGALYLPNAVLFNLARKDED